VAKISPMLPPGSEISNDVEIVDVEIVDVLEPGDGLLYIGDPYLDAWHSGCYKGALISCGKL